MEVLCDDGNSLGWVLTEGRCLVPPLGVLVTFDGADQAEDEERRDAPPDGEHDDDCKRSIDESCQKIGRFLLSHSLGSLDDSSSRRSSELKSTAWLPASCASDHEGRLPYAKWRGTEYRCDRCGRVPENQIDLLSTERWLSRLSETTFLNPVMTQPLGSCAGSRGPMSMSMVKQRFVHEALELAVATMAVLGPQHWTVQWSRILLCDLILGRISYQLDKRHLTPSQGDGVITFLVQNLVTLWDWLRSLGLAHDPSCFLHPRVAAVLQVLRPHVHLLAPLPRSLLCELQQRHEATVKQVEILALQPLVVENSLSMQ